jgi:ABC-type bacteriocin/lantibiotic exporter with double-glycine peptidase domain
MGKNVGEWGVNVKNRTGDAECKVRSTSSQVARLWGHLLPRRKRQLAALSLFMIVASFAEVLSIGSVLPFLGVLTAPEKIFAHEIAQPFIILLQIKSAQDLLMPFTITFIIAAVFSGLARIALLWVQTRLSMAIGADFSVQVYERTLYQPYSLHVSRNSSEILAGVRKAESLVQSIIQPVMIVISSLVILLAVIATLLVIQPTIALIAFLGFGLIYAVVVSITKRRVEHNSQIIAAQTGRVVKAIQEGLGGIRDVLIDSTQPVYSKQYKDAFLPMQAASASNQVVGGVPRFGVEALGMVLIAGLAYVLAAASGVAGGATNAIPILGALALGAQRLLPVLQQIYNAYITMNGSQASTQDALDLLEQPMPEHAHAPPARPIAFNTSITLKDLGFRYTPHGPWVLQQLNLEIPKGSRVGFLGVTGSGKSTLLDLVMGLLTPTVGTILIDNTVIEPQNTRAWQAHISHVPQEIFLSDTCIAENIAFGVPPQRIELQRVKQAAQQAQIAQTIEGWRNGYDTLVGERGVRLSGGQRQRIGIARALYRRANVIIFDEATSALDNETEAAVMQAVETLGRDITILIIAHRLTTLRNCDCIVELANGGIKAIGGYEQMIRRAA